MTHRRPPLPHFYTATRGFCRWCGEAIELPDGSIAVRRKWHRDCVFVYLLATNSEMQRTVAFDRAGGICQGCGLDFTRALVPKCGHYRPKSKGERLLWHGPPDPPRPISIEADGPCSAIMWRLAKYEADHDVPLWSVDRTAPNALWFWSAENLRLLCISCHRRKTAREAEMRAKERRQRQKLGVDADKPKPRRGIASLPF